MTALQKVEVEELHLAVAGREGVQHADSDAGWSRGLATQTVRVRGRGLSPGAMETLIDKSPPVS